MPATLAPEYYVSTSYASLSGIMKLRISERERERQRGEKRWEGETERVTGSFEMQIALILPLPCLPEQALYVASHT